MFKARVTVEGQKHADHVIEAVARLPRGPSGLDAVPVLPGKWVLFDLKGIAS